MITSSHATRLVALAAAAIGLMSQPALAGPNATDPEPAPAAHPAAAATESPAAAFERMLGARTPTPSAAVARDEVDVLQAPFRAALWRPEAPAPVTTAAAGSPEVRK